MEETRGEWTRYYPYVLITLVILVGGSAALASYVREMTGSWAAFLISPIAAEIFVVFLIVNRKRFDGRPLYDGSDGEGTNRCLWCDSSCSGWCCSPECERLYGRFEDRLDRYAPVFIALLVPVTLLAAAGYYGGVLLGAGLLTLGYGVLLITLPEVVAGTAMRSNAKAAMMVCRILGLMFLIFSCAVLTYACLSD